MISYNERMEKLKTRGVLIEGLFSDWCVDCKFSDRIYTTNNHYICSTGCNGYPEFVQNSNGSKKFTGSKPLKYEQEEEVNI